MEKAPAAFAPAEIPALAVEAPISAASDTRKSKSDYESNTLAEAHAYISYKLWTKVHYISAIT